MARDLTPWAIGQASGPATAFERVVSYGFVKTSFSRFLNREASGGQRLLDMPLDLYKTNQRFDFDAKKRTEKTL